MAVFADEAGVRLRSGVDDTAVASSALVAACIADAHERVVADLAASVDVGSPPEGLVQGETLLAAGLLMAALASGDAMDQVELQIGGQRLGAGQRFASLMSMARRFEKEAAVLLAPFGTVASPRTPGEVTATKAVLGT